MLAIESNEKAQERERLPGGKRNLRTLVDAFISACNVASSMLAIR